MKIIVAPDSFKGTNSAIRMCEIIHKGIDKVFPGSEVIKIPVADGGEGTVDSILYATGGEKISVKVSGPLGEPVKAFYGIEGKSAIIEMAAASGLPLIPTDKRNPLHSSTFGTGELIKEVIERGYRKILIGIGGSATNDGGLGMAMALGYRFLDPQKKIVTGQGGAALKEIAFIDDSEVYPLLKETRIIIACDVTNPLLGDEGASAVYGPQKGASVEDVRFLDKNLSQFSNVVQNHFKADYASVPGAGAAGGLGFGLMAFCGAEMRSGIETILEFSDMEKHLYDADLVITGEGKIDGQSIRGKVPVGVAALAKQYDLPVLVMAGDIGAHIEILYDYGIDSVMSSVNKAMPLSEALENSSELMLEAVERAMRILKIGMTIQIKKETDTV